MNYNKNNYNKNPCNTDNERKQNKINESCSKMSMRITKKMQLLGNIIL